MICFDVDDLMLYFIFIQPFKGFLTSRTSAVTINLNHNLPPIVFSRVADKNDTTLIRKPVYTRESTLIIANNVQYT